MLEHYSGAGLALLEARAEFKVASQYGEDIDIESEVVEFRRSSFFVEHRVSKKGQPMLKGFETVCGRCATRDRTDEVRQHARRDHRGIQ